MRYVTSVLLLLFLPVFCAASNLAVTYYASIINVSVNRSSFCDGQSVTVAYTASISGSKFGNDNIFTAQLSNSSGSFSSPVNIGTLKSKQSGVINAIIPAGTANGTLYRIRVVSSSPVITSSPNGSNITITVSPAAPASVSATPPAICPGASSNLNAVPTGNSIRWYTAEAGGTLLATRASGADFSVSPMVTTAYFAESLNAAGCSSPARTKVTVTVNTVPTITGTAPGSVCSNGTVTLSATSSAGIINWYSAATGGVISGTGTSFTTPVITMNTTYYVDATANGCVTAQRTAVNATVNPAPAAPMAGTVTQPTCDVPTGRVVLSGLPASGTWILTISPGETTTSGTGTGTTISGLAAGIYSFKVANSLGCISQASGNVVINSAPGTPSAPVAGGITQPTCAVPTGSVVLNDLPASGTWTLTRTPGGTTISGTGTGTTITGLAAGTYTFMVTNTAGCISVASANVLINIQPAVPTANAGTGGNECDLNFKFSAIPSIGTGIWTQTTGTGISTFAPDAKNPGATVTVSTYGNYTFTWTETSGTCSKSSIISVNFYQKPEVNAGTGGNNCGLEFSLGAKQGIGAGTWTLINGPGTAIFSPNANSPNAKVTASAYGTHTFQWTEVNGICSNSATVTITFYRQSAANAGKGGDECDKDFILNAVPGAIPGTWTKIAGPGNAIFSPGANQANARITVSQPGTYDLAWTETNSFCSSTDIVKVSFHDLPSINAGADLSICKGGSIQLNASGSGSFQWNPANLVNNHAISNPIVTPVFSSVFTVILTDQWGCKNSDQVSVDVREKPVANAGPDQVLKYQFETTLKAADMASWQTGEWTVITGTGQYSNKNDNATVVRYLSPDKNIFKWTVSDGVCPSSSDTVNIIVHDLIIPTLITPNNDGKNDYFIINGLETLGKTDLVIFNRWGARVYANENYNNRWNGEDNNIDPLADDTYFFVLRSEKGRHFRGYIVLKR